MPEKQCVRPRSTVWQAFPGWYRQLCQHLCGCSLHPFCGLIHALRKDWFANKLQEACLDIFLQRTTKTHACSWTPLEVSWVHHAVISDPCQDYRFELRHNRAMHSAAAAATPFVPAETLGARTSKGCVATPRSSCGTVMPYLSTDMPWRSYGGNVAPGHRTSSGCEQKEKFGKQGTRGGHTAPQIFESIVIQWISSNSE